MSLMGVVTSLLVLSPRVGSAQPVDRPPRLTFDIPIDYMTWYSQRVERPNLENAYPSMVKLAKAFEDIANEPRFKSNDDAVWHPMSDFEFGGHVWDAKEFPELDAFLAANEAPLLEFERLSRLPGFWNVIPADADHLFGIPSPGHSGVRLAFKRVLTRAWRRSPNQSRSLTDAHLLLARQFGQMHANPEFVNVMSLDVYIQFHCSSIRAALQSGLLNPADVRKTSEALRGWRKTPIRLDEAYRLGWAEDLDKIQYLFPKGQKSEARFRKERKEGRGMQLPDTNADPQELIGLIDDTYGKCVQIAGRPMSLENWHEMVEHLEGLHPEDEFLSFKFPHVLRSMHGLYCQRMRADASWRATVLSLAIHDFKARRGRWPARLDDLDSSDLKEFKVDPYSKQSFVYRLQDDAPLLYSVAENGVDDGGVHASTWSGLEDDDKADFVFLPHQHRKPFWVKPKN